MATSTTNQFVRGGVRSPSAHDWVDAARLSSDFEDLFIRWKEYVPDEAPLEWPSLDRIWVGDFEFYQPPGERPSPHCCVFRNLGSEIEFAGFPWPEAVSPEDIFVFYYAPADLSCYITWAEPMPSRVVDLYAEFRNWTNGKRRGRGEGLYDAMDYFGLPHDTKESKAGMHDLATSSAILAESDIRVLQAYCTTDVRCTADLFKAMLPLMILPQALLRGRYAKAVARMEAVGTPIDYQRLEEIRTNRTYLQQKLIDQIGDQYPIYEKGVFKQKAFTTWVNAHDLPWPRLKTGKVALDKETFEYMSETYPIVEPLAELRSTLGTLRTESVSMGRDGRNRCMLSPFRAQTGRNQPSNSKFVFGQSAWMRYLIRPEPGQSIAYLDWEQQEFAIAAALSKDENMIESYLSGDPYLHFAQIAYALPGDTVRAYRTAKAVGSRPDPDVAEKRDRCKQCILAVQYGLGVRSLAHRLRIEAKEAAHLMYLHRSTYRTYWMWSQWAIRFGLMTKSIHTVFGWRMEVMRGTGLRSLMNFPMQANGAEMLRLGCCYLTEDGIAVCAPVHDAVLIGAPSVDIDRTVARAQRLMEQASLDVLQNLTVRTEAYVVRHPDTYTAKKGEKMWLEVQSMLKEKRDEDKEKARTAG